MHRRLLVAALLLVSALSAAAADALPNPLKNIKVGQWVEYRIYTPDGDITRKQTLTAIDGEGDDRVLTFKISLHFEGEPLDEGEQQITYGAAVKEQEDSMNGADGVTVTKVKTAMPGSGEEIDAVLVTFVQEDTRFSLYMSEDIPIVGMVKMMVDGMEEPAMELIGFGE